MAALSRQSCPLRPTVTFNENPAASEGVETDPSQRYLRYPLLLGRGACKRVYKAFDQVEGIEVAWNQVELSGSDMDEAARERLFGEIRVLQTLKHRNIMRFYDWWYDAKTATINFITEYFTSGNLRQYRKKHKHISEQAIKRWAFQILEGLMYLHAHDPPIVHRDLKCDNILVNGTSGQVKIADLGLASCQRGLSVVGTPEFMAPEIYDEVYDERVDIYSFGMCMLELATLEYPYSECRSIPAIFRKVSQGIPPAALAKVTSQPLREFITTCINPDPTKRPHALQLLRHEFFDSLKPESDGGKHSGYLNIPFGSCGNLQSLGVSGSHSRSSFGRNSRPRTLSCAECTAAARAAKQAAIEQAEDAAAASARAVAATAETGSAVADSSQAGLGPWNCASCGVVVQATNGVGSNSSQGIQQCLMQQDSSKLPALTAIQESSYARGRSICLAALNRSEPEAYAHCCEEDSDDEVVVSLEDVLTPHPEDLLDPDTSHLHSTLRHAGSGCTIVSGPNCNLEGRLSGLSLSGLLDQAAATSSFSSGVQTPSGLASKSAQYAAAGFVPLGRSARSCTDTRPTSATEGPAAAAADGQISSNSSRRSSTLHSAGLHTTPGRSAAALGSSSGSGSLLGSLSESVLVSHRSDASAMAAVLSSRSPGSLSAAQGSPGLAAAAPDQVLHRSVSTCSLPSKRGVLAAAGLLQMSPGVFVSTPALLEKLLSRNGRPPLAKRTVGCLSPHHKRSASSVSGGRAVSAGQQQAADAGAFGFHQHGFRSNSFSAPSLEALVDSNPGLFSTDGAPHASVEQIDQEQQGASILGASSRDCKKALDTQGSESPGLATIDSQQAIQVGPTSHASESIAGEASLPAELRSCSVTFDGSISAAAAVQAARHCSTPESMACVLSQGNACESSDLTAAAEVAGTAGAGSIFGRIVVRRRFARNLQKRVAVPLQRSKSV